MRIPALLLLSVLAVLAWPALRAHAAGEVRVRLLAVNDFHGALEPAPYAFAPGEAEQSAGGAVALASLLARLRDGQPHTLLVSAGDLIGASPLPSALAHDEPTLKLFDLLGLQANAIGNHELDGGLVELKRQQALVGYPFLSANLVGVDDGKPVFPAYRIIEVDGVRLALVGATARSSLKPLEPDLVPGLRLDDEAEAINLQVALLRAQGVRAIVVLLHEGAEAQGAVNEADCAGLQGPAREIAAKLDREVDLVLSSHSHRVYACRLDGRWLTQAGANGRYVTVADLRIDHDSGDVLATAIDNQRVLAEARTATNAQVTGLVNEAVVAADRIAKAPVARLSRAIVSAVPDREGGSPLGRMVARAQLAAAKALGAELACTNPSSVPRDLIASQAGNLVTYADVRATQPYGNRLKVRQVAGAQLRALLEQQQREGGAGVELSCSPGLEFRRGVLRLHGRRVADSDQVTMVVNSYLARGGQGFTALMDTPELGEAGLDLDALLAWLRAGNPIPGAESE